MPTSAIANTNTNARTKIKTKMDEFPILSTDCTMEDIKIAVKIVGSWADYCEVQDKYQEELAGSGWETIKRGRGRKK